MMAIVHVFLGVTAFQLYAVMNPREHSDLCKMGNREFLYVIGHGEP